MRSLEKGVTASVMARHSHDIHMMLPSPVVITGPAKGLISDPNVLVATLSRNGLWEIKGRGCVVIRPASADKMRGIQRLAARPVPPRL